jgi:hypothetical protein
MTRSVPIQNFESNKEGPAGLIQFPRLWEAGVVENFLRTTQRFRDDVIENDIKKRNSIGQEIVENILIVVLKTQFLLSMNEIHPKRVKMSRLPAIWPQKEYAGIEVSATAPIKSLILAIDLHPCESPTTIENASSDDRGILEQAITIGEDVVPSR